MQLGTQTHTLVERVGLQKSRRAIIWLWQTFVSVWSLLVQYKEKEMEQMGNCHLLIPPFYIYDDAPEFLRTWFTLVRDHA